MKTLPGIAPARRLARFVRSSAQSGRRTWAAGGVILTGLVLSGCQIPGFGAYPGETSQGHDAFKLWQGFFILGSVVFLLVFVLIAWSVLRYRKSSDTIPKQTQYHRFFELVYTIVPIITVLVLFGFTFFTENNITVKEPGRVTVDVLAFQWGWKFTYPTSDVSVIGVEKNDPEMVLPVNETIHITLQSADVIHGFYIPKFNYSEYAQPGHPNAFDINILHTGTYTGQCTQFCGLYHSYMLFRVKAVTQAQFTAWIKEKQNEANTTTSVTAAKHQSHSNRGGYG